MVYQITRSSTICLDSSIFNIGIVITLFFRCLGALFNTVHHPRGTIKWPLVAHTVAMFSILTVSIGLYLDTQSVAYIDDRNTPQAGDDDLLSAGPGIYREFLYSKANGVVLNIMISLNAWLADGLLVSPAFNSVPPVSDTGYSSSSAVAGLSTP